MEFFIESTDLNICPRCNNAFFIFSVQGVDDYIPFGVTPVAAQKQGNRPVYCPACGGDINTYKKEINADLDKLNKWRNWAKPTPKEVSNG
jgi:hypothetical protein